MTRTYVIISVLIVLLVSLFYYIKHKLSDPDLAARVPYRRALSSIKRKLATGKAPIADWEKNCAERIENDPECRRLGIRDPHFYGRSLHDNILLYETGRTLLDNPEWTEVNRRIWESLTCIAETGFAEKDPAAENPGHPHGKTDISAIQRSKRDASAVQHGGQNASAAGSTPEYQSVRMTCGDYFSCLISDPDWLIPDIADMEDRYKKIREDIGIITQYIVTCEKFFTDKTCRASGTYCTGMMRSSLIFRKDWPGRILSEDSLTVCGQASAVLGNFRRQMKRSEEMVSLMLEQNAAAVAASADTARVKPGTLFLFKKYRQDLIDEDLVKLIADAAGAITKRERMFV